MASFQLAYKYEPSLLHCRLSDDLLTNIFSFIEVCQLFDVEIVCQRWKLCCIDQLWEPFVHVFNKLAYNKPEAGFESNIFERIKRLSVSDLKRSLSRVSTIQCVEKIDFQRMLLRCLLLRPRHTFRHVHPPWSYTISKWKASFLFYRADLKRERILRSELLSITWLFRFKGNDQEMSFTAKFHADFTLITDVHEQKLRWEFVDYREGEGASQVNIEQYPTHTFSRSFNGQWMLENYFVWFEQVAAIPPSELPIV